MIDKISAAIPAHEIRRRILEDKLVEDYTDLETQLQPAGFDLCLSWVYDYKSAGYLDFDNKLRRIPSGERRAPDGLYSQDVYRWHLPPGAYRVLLKETLNMPLDLNALSIHRSSLMRMGCTTASGDWDPGYSGKGETCLIVHNPHGVDISEGARICQVTFIRTDVKQGYNGKFQNEGKRI